MCLAVIALDAHPQYRLVIAANRDEFHARAAEPVHWWADGVLAGRDRVGGGTWFGASRAGRWALITNFREAVPRDPQAPSRGELVMRALRDDSPPLACAASIAVYGARYHGFNLVVGLVDGGSNEAAYASNRSSGAISLSAGVHGLSNHLLDTPWPKLVRSKARLAEALSAPSFDTAAAFALLADRSVADDDALSNTGVALQRERLLSSAFIVSPEYGTRCSTVFALARDGEAQLVERTFDPTGKTTAEVAHRFRVAANRKALAQDLR